MANNTCEHQIKEVIFMFRFRALCLLVALACVLSLSTVAMAAEVDCDTAYCFSSADFSQEDTLTGICRSAIHADLPSPADGR